MTNITQDILDKAFKIGFTIETRLQTKFISLPCKVTLKNGQSFETAELVFLDNLFKPELFKTFSINEVDHIDESKFALSYKFRNDSLMAQEYRNDWPFFLRKKDKKILGYNAYSPVNFTYDEKTLGKDIIEVVSFDTAQNEKFDFIKDHDLISVKILCGKDKDIIDKIINNNNR